MDHDWCRTQGIIQGNGIQNYFCWSEGEHNAYVRESWDLFKRVTMRENFGPCEVQKKLIYNVGISMVLRVKCDNID